MKSLISFLLFTTCVVSFAGEVSSKYPFIEISGLKVSASCNKSCLALKDPGFRKIASTASNPLENFCQVSDGQYLVILGPNETNQAICRFKDQSYILARDYFTKFGKRK